MQERLQRQAKLLIQAFQYDVCDHMCKHPHMHRVYVNPILQMIDINATLV